MGHPLGLGIQSPGGLGRRFWKVLVTTLPRSQFLYLNCRLWSRFPFSSHCPLAPASPYPTQAPPPSSPAKPVLTAGGFNSTGDGPRGRPTVRLLRVSRGRPRPWGFIMPAPMCSISGPGPVSMGTGGRHLMGAAGSQDPSWRSGSHSRPPCGPENGPKSEPRAEGAAFPQQLVPWVTPRPQGSPTPGHPTAEPRL